MTKTEGFRTMKHLTIASKAIALLFSAALLVACSGSDTKEEDEATAAAAAAAAASASAAQAAQAAQGAAVSAEMAALEEAAASAGTVFYFEYDSANLTPEALDALNANIALLQRNNTNVRLEGHTDERGTREYNLALGEGRANSVREYMIASGIPGSRIETISFGEERPIAYGTGEANWSQNRRVELKLQ
jgi:peptidoglycan-associated lipoprotein